MAGLPPYAKLLNIVIDDEGEELLLKMPFGDDVVGWPGQLHGGAIAGLLEIAAFSTLARELGDPAVVMKPVTVTVDYMRPGGDRDTFAAAQVQRLGTNIANVEVLAWQQRREQPVASARLNFLLERPAEA